MSDNTADLVRWKKLLSFVNTNEHSDFYRQRFAATGFDPGRDFSSLADIDRIPFLTRADLEKAGDERLRFVPEEKVEMITATSGTTSGNPFLIFHSADPENPGTYAVTEEIRGLVLMNPIRAGHLLQRFNRGKHRVFLGDIHNIPTSLELGAKIKVREVMTTPTLAIMMKKYIDNQPKILEHLKRIRVMGEPLTKSKKDLLHRLYPELEIYARYGTAETNLTAFQCAHQSHPNDDIEIKYHVSPESFFYEIVDPESGKRLPFGERGELVVSSFSNFGTPLIRYRTGDLATLLDETCPCQAATPLLVIHGRAFEDSIRAGGFELKRDMVEAPMLRLRHIVRPDFEIHVHEEYLGSRPSLKVELHLSLNDGIEDSKSNREEIIREFINHWRISPTMPLKDAIANGLFQPLEVKFVEFPREAKAREKMILH